jgi:transcription initiation factor TFIIIB Brf1 subunit/transcription initiation factor TFIIB
MDSLLDGLGDLGDLGDFDDFNLDDFSKLDSINISKVYDLINDDKSEDSDIKKCDNCGGVKFEEDYTKGIIVCSSCGQVMDDLYAEDGGTKFDMDSNKRSNVVHNSLLPQSSLGSTQRVTGRLAQVSIWSRMPYKERSMNNLFEEIKTVCKKYNISKKIELDSKIICKKVCDQTHKTGKNKGKPIITRGENRKGIVASCLFIACSKYQETRSKTEIANYFGINEESLNKGYKSLKKILANDVLIADIKTSSVSDFIERKCDEMGILNVYKEQALNIAKNINKLNIASKHNTNSITSAVILFVSKLNNITQINKNIISKAFNNLSTVTIKKTYEEIDKFKPFLLNDELTNKLIKTFELRKKNKKVINKETYEKMLQFNIDVSKYRVMDQESIEDYNFIKRKKFYINQYEDIVKRNRLKMLETTDISEKIDLMKNIVSFNNQIIQSNIEILKRDIKEKVIY